MAAVLAVTSLARLMDWLRPANEAPRRLAFSGNTGVKVVHVVA